MTARRDPMLCGQCGAPVTDEPDERGSAKCERRCGGNNFPDLAKLSPGVNVRRAIMMRGGAPVLIRFTPKPKTQWSHWEPGWDFVIDDRRLGKTPYRDGYPGHIAEDAAWHAVARIGPILRWETVDPEEATAPGNAGA